MKTHRIVRASAWIASLVLALPLCAQDVPATPPAAAPAEQKSFAEGTADAAEAALVGAEEAGTPEGTEATPDAAAADAAEPPADTRALDETVQDARRFLRHYENATAKFPRWRQLLSKIFQQDMQRWNMLHDLYRRCLEWAECKGLDPATACTPPPAAP